MNAPGKRETNPRQETAAVRHRDGRPSADLVRERPVRSSPDAGLSEISPRSQASAKIKLDAIALSDVAWPVSRLKITHLERLRTTQVHDRTRAVVKRPDHYAIGHRNNSVVKVKVSEFAGQFLGCLILSFLGVCFCPRPRCPRRRPGAARSDPSVTSFPVSMIPISSDRHDSDKIGERSNN